jgi:hypothetical protein
VWCPMEPKRNYDARPDKDTQASHPMWASEPMASELMASELMPATPRIPWHGTYKEQRRQYKNCPHPLLPCSHDHHLSLRAHTLMFPNIVRTISRALPVESHGCAYEVSRVLTCVRLVFLTPTCSRILARLAVRMDQCDRIRVAVG